ncbi:1658_t:CDS:2 [Acaulospora colombiana]|uniref:1658_t:CDS:1 n=1 Tax=Acaulospora colombiana TaxID=27376 RepID=A0ACA9MUS3_9GLOM|nr:1658_t:CDS:2 [Acaulospora colombiana]
MTKVEGDAGKYDIPNKATPLLAPIVSSWLMAAFNGVKAREILFAVGVATGGKQTVEGVVESSGDYGEARARRDKTDRRTSEGRVGKEQVRIKEEKVGEEEMKGLMLYRGKRGRYEQQAEMGLDVSIEVNSRIIVPRDIARCRVSMMLLEDSMRKDDNEHQDGKPSAYHIQQRKEREIKYAHHSPIAVLDSDATRESGTSSEGWKVVDVLCRLFAAMLALLLSLHSLLLVVLELLSAAPAVIVVIEGVREDLRNGPNGVNPSTHLPDEPLGAKADLNTSDKCLTSPMGTHTLESLEYSLERFTLRPIQGAQHHMSTHLQSLCLLLCHKFRHETWLTSPLFIHNISQEDLEQSKTHTSYYLAAASTFQLEQRWDGRDERNVYKIDGSSGNVLSYTAILVLKIPNHGRWVFRASISYAFLV